MENRYANINEYELGGNERSFLTSPSTAHSIAIQGMNGDYGLRVIEHKLHVYGGRSLVVVK